jgi:hypothetical protein
VGQQLITSSDYELAESSSEVQILESDEEDADDVNEWRSVAAFTTRYEMQAHQVADPGKEFTFHKKPLGFWRVPIAQDQQSLILTVSAPPTETQQRSSVVERRAHNSAVIGSIPVAATFITIS